MLGRTIDFSGVSTVKVGTVPSNVYDRCMQAITDSQVRHLIFAGITGGEDFAFKSSATESAGHQDRGSPL